MKHVTQCGCCTECGVLVPVGFNSEPRYWCINFAQWVEPDDGCSFGSEGNPRAAREPISAIIDGYAAVGGNDDD